MIAATRPTASGTSGVTATPPKRSANICPLPVAGKTRSRSSAMRKSSPERAIAAARTSAPKASSQDELAKPLNATGSVTTPVAPHAAARPIATA